MFLYLADSLILLTFVQLVILISVMFTLFMALFAVQGWALIERRINQIRVMQVLVFLQLLAIFVL